MNILSRRKLLLLTSAACLAGPSAAMAGYKPDAIMRKHCIRMGGRPTRRFWRFYCDGVDQRRWERRFPPNQDERFLDRLEPRARSESGDNGGGANRSDRRLKRDIAVVGNLPTGLLLYRFKYLWSDIEFVGVMAQDVLTVMPEAVTVDSTGYYSVHYDAVGLPMMTYSQWLLCGSPGSGNDLAIAA